MPPRAPHNSHHPEDPGTQAPASGTFFRRFCGESLTRLAIGSAHAQGSACASGPKKCAPDAHTGDIRSVRRPVQTLQAVPARLGQRSVRQMLAQETSLLPVRPVHTLQAVPARLGQRRMRRMLSRDVLPVSKAGTHVPGSACASGPNMYAPDAHSGDIPSSVRPVHTLQAVPARLGQTGMRQMLTLETSFPQ